MHVTVKLYATLQRYAQGKLAGTPFEVELPDEATVRSLLDRLKIPPQETRTTFVNGIIQEQDWKLQDGDAVGMFPPIGGG